MLIYVTQKLKLKFDIRDSLLVTFLVREPCQRIHPPPPVGSSAFWLATRAGIGAHLASSGYPAFVPQEKVLFVAI